MRVLFPIAALASLVAACSSTAGSGAVASTAPAVAAPPPVEERAAAAEPAPRLAIPPVAIAESPSSRDPFRAFPAAPPAPPEDTRPRKARRVSVDQLKLVALVTNTATPRALLVDPSGKGYIVTRGELVGRPEPEGDRFASFRVDRIRDGNVVLVREDPLSPGVPTSTRVLALPRDPLLQADD